MKELSKQDIEVVLAGKGLPGELLAGESLAKYFARLYLHTKDSRDEQLSQRDAQIAALKADFIRLDRQMSVLEQTGITDRDRADKAEAQIAELANQEPVAWRIGGDGCPEHLSGDKKYAYEYPRRTIEPLFTRAAPPAPFVDPRLLAQFNRHRLLQIIVTGPDASGAEQNTLARIALAFYPKENSGSVADE